VLDRHNLAAKAVQVFCLVGVLGVYACTSVLQAVCIVCLMCRARLCKLEGLGRGKWCCPPGVLGSAPGRILNLCSLLMVDGCLRAAVLRVRRCCVVSVVLRWLQCCTAHGVK